MEYAIYVVYLLLIAHFVGDFICQTHWQAVNKSTSINALSRHVASYTAVILIASIFVLSPLYDLKTILTFVGINGVLHFVTDFFTSKITSRLWAKQDWHNFFCWIGLDQLIHQSCLIGTFWLMMVR